ncbi:hypothetical protein CAOG_05001 [Capsaspora owczarzaki ATCC 30864]|uniref:FYVE-type domain-containing protein n=1 Tax=Capsaspora owczarzaki (strain ATCC 30864) TaxID=595528 RepID=A0A0D2WSD5_CAPO3|nr:hypothetical protein CAOG_05001 [Capsaspora owczarzaki ATCC 30864]KJE94343.1 hypothetical protein CAOG_005001 [Capsaspora owczarzaki ATCC 30864]|eukprot:XP_004346686.1 hypothetical protein CAOG_05001 [Capsaspora owczarzaki ATCC 30864]
MPRANKDALEYLGVFFVKMDLSVRRVTQSSESPSLLMQDLAGIFAPYLLRPSLWTNADASEKQRTRVVQRSFLLHFLFFVKKKHNLMTRSERTSMDSTEDELVDDLLLRAIPASARFNMAFASTFASAPSVPPSLSASLVSSGTTGASHFHPTGQSFGAASAVTDPGSEGSDNDDDNDLENVSQSRTTTRRNSLRSMTSTTSSVKAPKFVKHAFVEVWVDALPTAPSVLSAPLQRLVPADRLRQPEATPSSEQSSVRLVPFLVAENTHMGRVALGESSLSLDAAASHAVRALDFDTKRKKRHLQRRGTATSLASVKSKSAAGLLIRVQGPVPTFITPDSEIPFRGSFVHPEGFVVLPRQASPTPPNLPSLNNSNNHRSQTSDGGTNGTNGAIGGGEPGSYLALPDALPPHLRKTRPRASFSKVSAAFSRDPHDEDWGLGPIEHPASVVMESTSETNPRAAVVEASLVQAHASGALLLDPYMEANEAATADDSGDASDDSENEDDSPVAEDASMNEQVDQSYSTSPALTASAASREETYSNGSTDDHIHHLISLDSTEEAAAKRAAQKQSTIPQSHPVDDGDQSTLPAFSVLSHEQTDAQLQPALAEHSTPNLPAASGARVKTIRRPALETLSESVSARGIVQLDWVQDASTKARTAFLQDSPSIARWLQAPILQGDPELMPNFDLVVFGGIGATGMESEALYDKKATARMQRYSGSFGVHFEAPGRGLVHLVTNIGHSELPLSSNESAREQDRAWGSSSEVMDHLRNRSTSVKTTNSVQFSVHIGEGAAVLASGAVETDSLSALEPQLAAVAEDLDTTLTGSLSQSIASLDSLVSLEAAPPVVVVSSLAPREHPDETSSSQSPEQQPSPLPELLLKQADEQQNAPPHDLQPHPHTEAVERPADHTSPSPKSPAADFKRPSVMVANYDNAMAFPRTHALYAGDRLQAESDIVQFFLSFASQVRKAEFIYDQQSDLLNQKLPRLHDGSRCENCGAGITTLSFSRKGRRSHCGYCGRLLCSACCDRNFVIPARIVQRGDLTPHVVCQACEAHLQCHLYAPLIELNALSAEAILEIGRTKVETMLEDCAMLMRYIYYHVLPACPSRQLLLSLLPSRIVPLLLVYQDSVGARISLADLCELPTRQFAEIIHAYRQLFGHHVQYCKHCSQLKRECCAKELCTRPPHSTTPTPVSTASPSAPSSGSTLLDPTAKSTELMLCPRCMQYCHVECWRAVESQCLACAAKPQTNVRLILPAEAPQNFGLSARNRLAGAAVSVPTLVGATAAAPSTLTAVQAEAPDSARSSTTLSIASVPATQASDSQARRGSLASAGDGGDAPSLASTLSPSQRSSLQQFNVASPTPSLLAAQPHSFNPSVEGVDLSTLPGETLLWDVAVHDFFSAA